MSSRSLILTIARHEFAVNVRRPGFIFFTLLIPAMGLLGLLIIGFFSNQALNFLETNFDRNSGVKVPTGLVDESGLVSPVPAEFAEDYRLFPDDASARAALLAGDVNGYVVIPADYVQTGEVTSYAVGGLFDAADIDSDELHDLLIHGLLAGKVDDAVLERVNNPADVSPVMINDQGERSGFGDIGSVLASFIIPYVLSVFLIISVFTASSYLLRSVSEEKETRVIEVVLSSVTAAQLLAGKVLGLGALGLTQVLVWLTSVVAFTGGLGAVVAGLIVTLNPVVFILSGLYFLLGYLLFGTLMAAAGSLGTSQRESQQMAGLFSFGAAVPFMFNSLIFANPNGPIPRFLSMFPLTAPTAMMLRLPLTTVSPLDLAISLGGLLITIPLALWAGAKVFRMGLLLYGKRPSLKQIFLALRQA